MLGTAPGNATFAAVFWLHHGHALIACRHGDRCEIQELDRDGQAEGDFLRRVAEAAPNCRRMVILGPDEERLAFDHLYDELYARSSRFVDVEACAAATMSDLRDRLRFLEGAFDPPRS